MKSSWVNEISHWNSCCSPQVWCVCGCALATISQCACGGWVGVLQLFSILYLRDRCSHNSVFLYHGARSIMVTDYKRENDDMKEWARVRGKIIWMTEVMEICVIIRGKADSHRETGPQTGTSRCIDIQRDRRDGQTEPADLKTDTNGQLKPSEPHCGCAAMWWMHSTCVLVQEINSLFCWHAYKMEDGEG